MNKRIYLTSLKWVFELHLFFLLVIRKLSSLSGFDDEYLKVLIDTASFTVSELKEELQLLKSQDKNGSSC
ncbi:hypothetical protein ACFLRY_00930 [Bacteroidota bacterium]